ncbi:MAG TPA: hypothetical protein VMD47_09590 [Candidatus Acidoferrales bacterium]|nr:hypothetical protein [Candidatus Acidoferrales bacterium]
MREYEVVHIVEAQDLFVPTLVDVFDEAGMHVDRVDEDISPQVVLDEQPDLLFVDTDYLDDPLRAIRLAHVLAPGATIVAYSAAESLEREAIVAAGASFVLAKSEERSSIVDVLKRAVHRPPPRRGPQGS